MNIFNYISDNLKQKLNDMVTTGALPPGLSIERITVEPPRDPTHGDISTNAALVLAKPAGLKPRDVANSIADLMMNERDLIAGIEVAGPGFINMSLTDEFWQARIPEILTEGTNYGNSQLGEGQKVNVEYVSANPTGPLHVGHVRGAVFGDALAGLLHKAGFSTTKEYYFNDAGAQIDTLARSVFLRYQQALGKDIGDIPEGLYPGDYLIPVGKAIADDVGDKWLNEGEGVWLEPVRKRAVEAMMDLIREDLEMLGVRHDVFFSETSLHTSGGIAKAIAYMEKAGYIYEGVLDPPKGKKPDDWEPRPQTLFRATSFGDDVDRAIKKSDGSYTYFAADIAYHFDKIERGFSQLIDVLGADHGGYVKRLKAVVNALSDDKVSLDVRLCQMVRLFKDGAPFKMSKRSGSFISLRDLVDEVGPDVVRFIMLTRKNDAQLDFDFEKATEQSKDNPVFYVQYGHARVHSVLKKAGEQLPGIDLGDAALAKADFSALKHEAEIALIKQMAAWPRMVEAAAEAHEPHRIAFYLYELASEFHSLWNKGNDDPSLRFIQGDDEAGTKARLAMIVAFSRVIASGLKILGVEPLKEMR
jgi:arginyl-tRNA synthetase